MCRAIKFHGWDCCISMQHYVTEDLKGNKRIALTLEDEHDDEPVAVATINVPDEPLDEDEVIIKDYSENEGMLDTLVTAGIISMPLRYVNSGTIKAPICKLLIPRS